MDLFDRVTPIDRKILDKVAMSSAETPEARELQAYSRLGTHGVGWTALALAVVAVDKPRRRLWLRSAILPQVTLAANSLVKWRTRRPRPAGLEGGSVPGTSSFPSAHASVSIAFAVGCSAVSRRTGYVVWPAATLMAWSRVALAKHYPSDVAAGAALGYAVGRIYSRLLLENDPGAP